MRGTVEIPLFPLRTVLFPGGALSLRIFEQRYLNMVRECAKAGSGFGVVLITEGEEAVSPVRTAETGTLARIEDFFTLEDGLLGLATRGMSRFLIEDRHRQDDGLMVGSVMLLAEPAPCDVPPAYSVLSQVLERLLENLGDHYPDYRPEMLEESCWVGYRLSELLPLSGIEKQHLLELSDPLERLQSLLELLPRFQSG